MLYLHTQVSYPTPIDGLAGCTTQPGGEPAKPAGKYREKIAGKDRGALHDVVPVSSRLQELIDDGVANFVLVEDDLAQASLSQLECFAYHPDRITFIVHKAEQTYVHWLLGENVPKELFQKAAAVMTELQREHYSRGKAGRPPDLARQQKAFQLLREAGPMKGKAASLSQGNTAKDLSASQAYLTRQKKLLG